MKNISCNNSSLVCINHFRECDYKISGGRWLLEPAAVPSQFEREFERSCEIRDDDDQTLQHDENTEAAEKVDGQKNELKQLEAEKNFWKEECMALTAKLVKAQEKYDKFSLNVSVCISVCRWQQV